MLVLVGGIGNLARTPIGHNIGKIPYKKNVTEFDPDPSTVGRGVLFLPQSCFFGVRLYIVDQ